MSNFYGKAINPRTEEIETALFIDDHFGKYQYGVRFPSDGPLNTPYYRMEDVAAIPQDAQR